MSTVTIIVPAFNAAETITATLATVQAQTFTDWRLVVIDDGSTDATAAIATRAVAGDARVTIVRQSNSGLSAARNRGVAEAQSLRVLFLDSDDTIAPEHLESLLAAVAEDDRAVAYSAYRRVAPDGRMLLVNDAPYVAENPFLVFAHANKIAVHCALMPRTAFERVGLFDVSLASCEDWDLWQRLARAGYRFAATGRTTAFYRTHHHSMSRNFAALAEGGLEVLARCRRADQRVQSPPPEYAQGFAGSLEPVATHFLLWCATASLAAGQPLDPRLTQMPHADLAGEAESIIATLRDALAAGGLVTEEQLGRVWDAVRGDIAPLLERICAPAAEDGLARRIVYALERQLIRDDPLSTPLRLGLVHGEQIDLHAVHGLAGAPDLRHLRVMDGSQELFRQELPSWGEVSASKVRSIIRAELAQERAHIPRSLTKTSRLRSLGQRLASPLAARLRRASDLMLRRATTSSEEAREAIKRRVTSEVQSLTVEPTPDISLRSFPTGDYSREYWDHFFERVDPWQLSDAYEQRKYEFAVSLIADRKIGLAAEIGCAEGHFSAVLAPHVERLIAIDIAEPALARAAERCATFSHIEYRQADLTRDPLPQGLELVVCSEILYYLADEEQLRRAAVCLRDSLAPRGLLLTTHSLTVQDDATSTGFDWGLPGADSFAEVFRKTGGLVLEQSLRSDLYRVDLWRRDDAEEVPALVQSIEAGVPRPDIQRSIRWGGIAARAEELCKTTTTRQVPILMYHMVGSDGPSATARYRTSPSAFEEQMRLLRRNGFYPITSAQFDWYRICGEALPGRPVMLTFDDGYRDFYETAWPILYRNDFRAEVFVVTDKVGKSSDWDRRFGEPQPLMNWREIALLHAQGIAFGSHLASHRYVDSLSSPDLYDEALRSRLTIERKLGCEVRSIASPSGGLDERAIRIFDQVGYHVCYSTREGVASVDQHSLNLPRIEVYGGMQIEEFARQVGLV